MSVIFISYRRSDSQDVTGRIYDRLLAKFTAKQVFKDVDSIPMGISFPLHIKQMLGKARAVLVIIGPDWLDAQDEQGNPRLEHPDDYVRMEIEIALRAAVPVVPVLVSHARMPSSNELPRSLRQLARRNGMAIRPDPDFNNDIARLISELDKLEKLVVAKPAKPPSAKFPAPKSATVKRPAAIPAEPLPVIRPPLIDKSSAVDQARQHAVAEGTSVSRARPSRNRFVLPMAGLFLLVACTIGLWAGGLFRQPIANDGGKDEFDLTGVFAPLIQTLSPQSDGSGGDYDLTGGDRFVHFGPNGPRVVMRHNNNGQRFVRVYDLKTGKAVTPPLTLDGYVNDVEFSPDGKRVVAICGGKTSPEPDAARLWDVATGKPLAPTLQQAQGVRHAAFSPNSKLMVVSGSGGARVWDAATGDEIGPTFHPRGFGKESRFSPDGKRAITVGGEIGSVWNPVTGKEVTSPLRDEALFKHAFFSPDSKRVVTTSYENMARVWDAATGQEITPPLKHKRQVSHACFSPDSKRIATASDDQTAQVWDAATGQALTPPLTYGSSILRANFSADGARVVTASFDKTARVWDASTGQELPPPLKHEDYVKNAAFTPDGKQLVTITPNSCRLWDAQTGQELKKVTISPQ